MNIICMKSALYNVLRFFYYKGFLGSAKRGFER